LRKISKGKLRNKKGFFMNIKKDITQFIANTPLIRLNKLSNSLGVEIVAKCEFLNPSGSIKDRVALFMIEEAKKKGLIDPNTTIIEPTSGNTGIALASICASLGLKLILTMPKSMSKERRTILKAYGAKLELTPAKSGMQGAIDRAYQLQNEIKNSYIPQQFENEANKLSHIKTTALEILKDTDGEFDYFVSGVGTGGTFTGCSKVFKKELEDIKCIAVEPKNSAVLSGEEAGDHNIQGIGAGFIPKIVEKDLIDEVIKVGDEEAFLIARNLAKDEGLLVGISSGANIFASIMVAKRYSPKRIVTILPDTGERYLSSGLFG
jgi:cysteine synthase A